MAALANDPPFDMRDARAWMIQLNDAISSTLINTSQSANRVFAAPDGSPGTPTFRALVATDIPSLAASKVTSGTFANTLINWASPSAIGGTTPAAATFTNLTVNDSLNLANVVVNITSSYVILATDKVIINNYILGTGSVTLPAASNGRVIMIKNISTQSLTVNRAGADTINAPGTTTTVATSFSIATGTWAILIANSAIWYAIN